IRQAIIGPPTSRQSDLYNVAVDTCYTGLDLIREGAIPEEISRTVDSFAERSRFSAHYRSAGWCGHSLGLTVHEPPMIEVGNRRPLQAGNVLAIEPDFLEEGVGVFGIEQNVLVKEDGYELLSPVDHGLWVI
ncbi:MAG: M24 family metallopeptidase, partial [Candidatus Latescibacteria bacterium]|nr:M24 family metallopeptidase [Candidatus Latescibacterota bacterium]